MENYVNEMKVPQDRVAVIIGANGETKNLLEKQTGTKLSIDSKECEVKISGDDPIAMFSCAEIIKAIARGFNPETALLLKKIDYVLEVISLMDYAKTKNDMIRLRGRVIGKEGKARMVLEDLLDMNICVYGKTISMIGRADSLTLGRRAMESLLTGSTHAAVYKWLEKQQSLLKQRNMADQFNIQ